MTADDPDALTEQQVRALDALLEGRSVTEAARIAGVTRQTASGWKHNHAGFRAAYNGALHDAIGNAGVRLVNLLPAALDVLAADLQQPLSRRTAAREIIAAVGKLPFSPGDAGSVRRDQQRATLAALVRRHRPPVLDDEAGDE